MEYYKTKVGLLAGSNYEEVKKQAYTIFRNIKRATKRKPYVRSPYFEKEKVFFDYFWPHLFQKPAADRYRRLKYFAAAIEVLKQTRHHPESVQNPNNKEDMLHRFGGKTDEGFVFIVQVKQNKRTGKKDFLSVFPVQVQ